MSAMTNIHRLCVKYGAETIGFDLIYNQRTGLTIIVYPDLRVLVKAPSGRSFEDVKERVKRRAPWILKQLNHFSQYHPVQPQRQYVSGETHYYLGRQYRLKVVEERIKGVKLIGKFIHVFTPDTSDKENIRNQLDRWYGKHAQNIFSLHARLCYEKVKRFHIPFPLVVIRKMKRRWGSLANSGSILLNTELIKTPLYCIDYVIMHEMCHLMIPKHNSKFYDLLNRCLPDWHKRKEILDRKGIL